MDGENKGKPYFLMDDLGGFYHPYFGKHPNVGKYTSPIEASWVGEDVFLFFSAGNACRNDKGWGTTHGKVWLVETVKPL